MGLLWHVVDVARTIAFNVGPKIAIVLEP